jgi:hypothetical protein
MAVMNNVRLRGDDWQDDENLAATQEGVAVPVGWALGSARARHRFVQWLSSKLQ